MFIILLILIGKPIRNIYFDDFRHRLFFTPIIFSSSCWNSVMPGCVFRAAAYHVINSLYNMWMDILIKDSSVRPLRTFQTSLRMSSHIAFMQKFFITPRLQACNKSTMSNRSVTPIDSLNDGLRCFTRTFLLSLQNVTSIPTSTSRSSNRPTS